MDWKIWMSSLIFVFVTILKLILPEQTEDVRQQVVTLIDMDMDYRGWIVETGKQLTNDSVHEVIHIFEADNSMEIPQSKVESTPLIAPTVTPTDFVDEAVQERVEAFYISQEVYSEYKTPSNVSYDCLRISFDFTSPVSGILASGFGYRVHPIDGQVSFHYGTDYDVQDGTAIVSFADGTVSAVGEEPGYGKYICVDHKDGWKSLYAHCSDTEVTVGQCVSMGDMIGKSGQTGRVTGPHLHFELMCNGYYTNPEFFFA